GKLAVQDAGDRYLLAAVMSSITAKNLDQVMLAALKRDAVGSAPPALVENLLRLASALGQTKASSALLSVAATPEKGAYAAWQFDALASLLDAFDQRGSSLAELQKSGDEEIRAAVKRLEGLFAAARTRATNEKTTPVERL